MSNPTRTRRRFTAQQKAEAVELCLQEGLSCNAVAQRLGLPSSSLARWVRQARIDRGQPGPRDQGLLSTRQAQEYYNRFFNVKFMTLQGDYNNCSHTCPRRDRVLLDMERELGDKERGLLKVSLDNAGYYRADELFKEVELVLEATCTACAAGR